MPDTQVRPRRAVEYDPSWDEDPTEPSAAVALEPLPEPEPAPLPELPVPLSEPDPQPDPTPRHAAPEQRWFAGAYWGDLVVTGMALIAVLVWTAIAAVAWSTDGDLWSASVCLVTTLALLIFAAAKTFEGGKL
jgi:hypothetical protein